MKFKVVLSKYIPNLNEIMDFLVRSKCSRILVRSVLFTTHKIPIFTHNKYSCLIGMFICGALLQGEASASAPAEKLSIPRYVSLRSNKINSHVGPGKTYPIEWVFSRQDLPVEIIAEFDTWRQIKDSEGAIAWVHKSLLSGKRTVLIKEPSTPLKRQPKKDAPVVAIVDRNVIAKVKECRSDWCYVEVKGHKGWVKRILLWGIYDHEEKFS